jgi:hypothetical protein
MATRQKAAAVEQEEDAVAVAKMFAPMLEKVRFIARNYRDEGGRRLSIPEVLLRFAGPAIDDLHAKVLGGYVARHNPKRKG